MSDEAIWAVLLAWSIVLTVIFLVLGRKFLHLRKDFELLTADSEARTDRLVQLTAELHRAKLEVDPRTEGGNEQ